MNLFAYGTLMDPEIIAKVTGASYRSQKANLSQYLRRKVWGEVYPAIMKRSGATVNGIVYFDIAEETFDRLDRFEGPLYVRKKVVVVCNDGESVGAYTYVISPNVVHQLSDEDWSFEDFLATGKQLFRDGYHGYRDLEEK